MADGDLDTLAWRKSTASFAGNCVLVASRENRVIIRDSADTETITLDFSLRDWSVFIVRVREDLLDVSR